MGLLPFVNYILCKYSNDLTIAFRRKNTMTGSGLIICLPLVLISRPGDFLPESHKPLKALLNKPPSRLVLMNSVKIHAWNDFTPT